jgi:nitrogen regulatory protein PII
MGGDARKLITCIVARGAAAAVRKRLAAEMGIVTGTVHSARGVGKLTPLIERGIGEQTEKDILLVTVSAERADEIFEFLFYAAAIDRPHGGLIFMTRLVHCTPFTLPDVPEGGAGG